VLPGAFRAAAQSSAPASGAARDLFVTVGKSLVVESPVNIQRISVGDAKKAEAMAVTPREVLVNGKEVGETSLIIWQAGGNRLLFDLRIQPSLGPLETARQQLDKELPGQGVTVVQEGERVFVRGTVDNVTAADRAVAIAESVGKPINLLRVKIPRVEDQILLKVRFADVDRTAVTSLGFNLASLGAGNTVGSVSTQQFSAPSLSSAGGGQTTFNLSDLLNIFLYRPDLNLLATIKLLQTKQLLQILAEPNLLAINGKAASFLAGGEFPVPVVQPSAGASTVTIMWKEFGVRVNFVPTITARGTIRLRVSSEVSSLDFANSVTLSGFTVPAIATRRMQTEVELQDKQSFAIAGLLDNRVIETWSKMPGLSSIPLLGKLFQSRSRSKTNSELLVLVTPEVVRPIPEGQPRPDVKMPQPPLDGTAKEAPRTPPLSATGPVPVPPAESMPVEELKAQGAQPQGQQSAGPQTIQLLAVPPTPAPPVMNPGTMTTPVPTPSSSPAP
jgi:pilus assembly protein CpaC